MSIIYLTLKGFGAVLMEKKAFLNYVFKVLFLFFVFFEEEEEESFFFLLCKNNKKGNNKKKKISNFFPPVFLCFSCVTVAGQHMNFEFSCLVLEGISSRGESKEKLSQHCCCAFHY